MRRTLLFIFSFVAFAAGFANDDNDEWEQWYEAVVNDEDNDEQTLDDVYELLNDFANNPININATKREELELLPFLSSQQVMDIMEYLDRYGPMKSKNELAAIYSLDYYRRKLLSCFIEIGERPTDQKLHLDKLLKYGKSEFLAYTDVPAYQRKGDVNGYLGYGYKHWLKYDFHYGKRLRFGIVASQDAGEPFFANRNKYGYDYYSPYFLLNGMGPMETIALGRYNVNFGMGLVVNHGFGFGKLSMLQSLGAKTPSSIRAHSSRSEESYFQGAAASFRLLRQIKLTAFASYRKVDATLNDNGSVATLISSGYHRTPTEMQKKNNTSMTDFGVNAAFDRNDLHIGATALATHFDRLLQPKLTTRYRRFYPRGHDFINFSLDYGYRHYPFAFRGESALDKKGYLATINSLTFNMSKQFNVVLLHRFYSLKYTSIHSYSFSEGGRVQNENGVYLGMEWKPSYGSVVMAYFDYAQFPWARYLVSTSSSSFDGFVMSSILLGKWTLSARYRWHHRQRDTYDTSVTTTIKPLVWQTDNRARIGVSWDNGFLKLSTQADASLSEYDDVSRGIMFSQSASVKLKNLTLSGSFKFFVTDDYDSRVYSYESGPLYMMSFPAFYGRGIRYAFLVKWKPKKQLTFYAKTGVTDYFDRDVIGSGLQQIDASSACKSEFELRWCF
ncbi:MAG: helix-hairpin-helix domain-containing protein [Prevotella sp.]